MARPSIRRFHPSTFSPREAYLRATETPREVRALAEGLIGWALINVMHDAQSPSGNLPELFGFRPVSVDRVERAPVYVLPTSDHARLFVSTATLWCVSADGTGTLLEASRFEPKRLPSAKGVRDERVAQGCATRCVTPIDWVLAWNHVAAAVRRLAEYEAWVQKRGAGLRRESERPKLARKVEVGANDLPEALRAIGEWAGDGEQAMLSWIVADAKSRNVEPDIPEQYRKRGLSHLLTWLRG